MRSTCIFGTALILSAFVSTGEALVKLKADVIYVQNGNTTSALFRCTAGESHMYYLNHIITWSKIGRDGRETYLSLNWDLVDSGLSPQYVISSQVFNEWSNNGTTATVGMYFVLGKTELTPEDHGEYICRLHDFDRNVLAQQSVPIIVFDKGLALSPYRIAEEAGRDIAVNCMLNTSISNGSNIALHHVTKDGVSKTVVADGKIVDVKLTQKYGFATRDNGDLILHNVLTLKAPSMSDDGHIVCEMRNASAIITQTNATVTIAEPKLKVSPLYFLKVPDDAVAHFKCECEILDTAACINNDMAWSVVDSTTGDKTIIYKNEQLLDKSGAYEILVSQNGSALNLTVNGLKKGFSQGREYVCSLHDKTTGNEVTFASIPVSVSSISLGALALLNKYPAEIRLLCTMRGSVWDSHYFEDHHLSWVHVQNGASKTVTLSGALQNGYSSPKYTVTFDSQRYYSILVIQDVSKADYGDYMCQLTNSHSGKLLLSKTLKMYGKDNVSVFA